MSPKDFFKVVIKIMALLVIVNGIIPAVANVFPWFGTELSSGFILLGIVLLFSVIVYLMITNSGKIVSFFGLDNGFETDKFDFSNIEKSYIIEISLAIIGFSIIFNSLPPLLLDGFMYFKSQVRSNALFEPVFPFETYLMYQNILSIMVGVIFIASRKFISKLID